MATRPASSPSVNNKSATTDPGFVSRSSPFTIIESAVSGAMFHPFAKSLALQCGGHARPCPQLKSQLAFRIRLGGVNDQCRLGPCKAWHIEFEPCLAILSRLRRKLRDVRSAVDSCGNQRARDNHSILLFPDSNVQIRTLARKPAFGIDQFQREPWCRIRACGVVGGILLA